MNIFNRILCATLPVGLGILYSSPSWSAEAAPDNIDEIIVTGSPLSVTSRENLTGISVLTGEELAQRLNGSLGETLKSEPGIASTFFGPGASRPLIRGQGGNRIRILDNGIGSIDASAASPDHAGSVEPAQAKRIEIVRGSGLLRYGSSGSGGIINVIDGRIPDRAVDDLFRGSARVSLSSVDNGYEGAIGSDFALSSTPTGDFVLHLDASTRKTKDYDIPDFAESAILRASEEEEGEGHEEEEEARDILENSATQTSSVAAGLSYIGAKSFFGVAIRSIGATYGIPGGHEHHEDEGEDHDHEEHDHEEEEGGVTIELEQTRFDVNSRFELDMDWLDTLSISGGYADYTHKELEGDGAIGTIFTNKGWEARAEIVQSATSHWQAAHGIQFSRREFSAIGEEAFVPPTVSKLVGIFSFHEWDLGDWHVEAAGRYEHNSHTNETANATLDFNGISVSAGVDYHISEDMSLAGSLYRTERAPTSEELFSNGPHLATNQFEVGDVSLGNETALGAEISLRYRTDTAHFTFNLFNIDYQDYIYERVTGTEQDELAVYQFTATDAVFKGFELDAEKQVGSLGAFEINMDASLEYVKATLDIQSDMPLPRIPPLGFSLGVSAVAGKLNLRTELEHSSAKDNISLGELPTEGYTLVNAFAGYDITENITLRLSVHNLTDQDARQHTSFLKDLVPLPGRNFRFSVAARF